MLFRVLYSGPFPASLASVVNSGAILLREALDFAEKRRQARADYLAELSLCKTASHASELQLDFGVRTFVDYLEEPLVVYRELKRQVLRDLPEQWHQAGNLVSAELSQFEYCPPTK